MQNHDESYRGERYAWHLHVEQPGLQTSASNQGVLKVHFQHVYQACRCKRLDRLICSAGQVGPPQHIQALLQRIVLLLDVCWNCWSWSHLHTDRHTCIRHTDRYCYSALRCCWMCWNCWGRSHLNTDRHMSVRHVEVLLHASSADLIAATHNAKTHVRHDKEDCLFRCLHVCTGHTHNVCQA